MVNQILKTERLYITKISEKYLEQVRELRNDTTVNRFLSTTKHITKEMQKDWFSSLRHSKKKAYKTVHLYDSTFIGIVRTDEIDRINRSLRIGLDLRKEYRGFGYAKEIYKAYISYLFINENINRIWLCVLENNEVARGLYKNLGFVEEGVMREAVYRNHRYYNYICMSLLKHEYEKKTTK